MARITYYKNSFLASVISIISSILGMFGGLMIAIAILDGAFENILPALLCLLIAFCGGALASGISEKKANEQWWNEQIRGKNLEERIENSVDFCFQVYNANPREWTLQQIEKLNPAAAAQIRQSLAAKQ